MKKNIVFTIFTIAILLCSCQSNRYSDFVGHWVKIEGNYYFNGSLESIDITKNGDDIFVKVNCRCDANGEKLAIKEDGKLKIPILLSGDNYLVLIEEGKQLKFLGDTFEKRNDDGEREDIFSGVWRGHETYIEIKLNSDGTYKIEMSAEGNTYEYTGYLEEGKLRYVDKDYQGNNDVHYFVKSSSNCIKDGLYEYCKD